jgi:hypothetical protein
MTSHDVVILLLPFANMSHSVEQKWHEACARLEKRLDDFLSSFDIGTAGSTLGLIKEGPELIGDCYSWTCVFPGDQRLLLTLSPLRECVYVYGTRIENDPYGNIIQCLIVLVEQRFSEPRPTPSPWWKPMECNLRLLIKQESRLQELERALDARIPKLEAKLMEMRDELCAHIMAEQLAKRGSGEKEAEEGEKMEWLGSDDGPLEEEK